MKTPVGWFAVLGACTALGCSAPKVEPEIASAAPQATYAQTYPAALTASSTGFSERQTQVRKVFEKFKEFPTKLKDPDWEVVGQVVAKADEVGKSHAYVDRMHQVDGAHVFFETEREELVRKVGGSAQYVVQQKNCDVEVTGSVAAAMKDTVEKQLEKELRDVSEAHLIITRNKVALKPQNVPELEKQADAIEFASYVVHIELVEGKMKMQRMLQEADAVRHTMDDFIEQEKAFQAKKGITDAEKKESADRIAAMQKAKGQLDTALTQAKDLAPKVEQEIKDIQKGYDDALADLKQRIKDKAPSKPAGG